MTTTTITLHDITHETAVAVHNLVEKIRLENEPRKPVPKTREEMSPHELRALVQERGGGWAMRITPTTGRMEMLSMLAEIEAMDEEGVSLETIPEPDGSSAQTDDTTAHVGMVVLFNVQDVQHTGSIRSMNASKDGYIIIESTLDGEHYEIDISNVSSSEFE